MRTISDFMREDFEKIEGWCSGHLFDYCSVIDAHHQQQGVKGGVAEIGVHHGKFFILLNWLAHEGEQSYAVDIFDAQELNIDNSGCGSLDAFKDNLAQYDKHRGKNVSIIAQDSTTFPLADVMQEPVRFFSVDGGHTVEHTISDLNLAHRLLAPQGVVILDDVSNPHWLGVIEGCMRFLDRRPTLVPFAVGQNKLLMANLSYVDTYREMFRTSGFCTKEDVLFCGYKIIALH